MYPLNVHKYFYVYENQKPIMWITTTSISGYTSVDIQSSFSGLSA